MSLESYGGNPDIIASRDEILRIAGQLQLAASELTSVGSLQQLLLDPVRQLTFRLASASVYSKLDQLHSRCILAAEGYFSTEAQIHRRFEVAFIPELARVVQTIGVVLGWKLDSGVSATLSHSGQALSPNSLTELLRRLDELGAMGEPTVGVDLFEDESNKLAVVYIPGTQSFDFGSDSNPLDMASNLQAMAQPHQAASERAVLLAMREAGVSSDHQVIFVGHSQGGMVGANLASNPQGYLAAGLIAFGAPIAHLRISKVPVIALEHSNDPVPQLSGKANPLRSNWVTIQRASVREESQDLVHSHSLESYKKSAKEADLSTQKGIRNLRSKIFGLLESKRFGKSNNFLIGRITKF